MYEHNDTPPEQSAEWKQDAIDVNDFVRKTGVRKHPSGVERARLCKLAEDSP
jgi:hypothetical protein